MTKKRFTVAVYDENAINGFTVLDLEKPNSSKRLKYENVYIGSKVSCEIVCNFGNSLTDENEKLKQFKEKVFTLIEEELEEHPYLTLTEKWNPNCKNYHSCRGNHEKNVFYASRHTLLEKLREKLSYD